MRRDNAKLNPENSPPARPETISCNSDDIEKFSGPNHVARGISAGHGTDALDSSLRLAGADSLEDSPGLMQLTHSPAKLSSGESKSMAGARDDSG